MTSELILASSSASRQMLMRNAGLTFSSIRRKLMSVQSTQSLSKKAPLPRLSLWSSLRPRLLPSVFYIRKPS